MEKIERNKIKILKLLNENVDLEYKKLLKKFIKTYEKEINTGTKKVPKMVIAKYGIWYEWFKDEDKPDEKGIRIERNQIIEVDGKRLGYSFFEIEDI